MSADTLTTKEQDTEEHWISISDMMAGLMAIFLFIAISYMLHIKEENIKIDDEMTRLRQIAVTYRELQIALYEDLKKEFENDLDEWNAVLNRDLSMWFKEPEVLFELGKKDVRPRFKKILDDFFPRYVRVLTETETKDDNGKLVPNYLNDISEIRIEGHTSSEWSEQVSTEEAYILNMELSQDRRRSVLEYVLQLPRISKNRNWLKQHLTANGLSSSKLIFNDHGTENYVESRRVEFRVRTNAEKRIDEMLRGDDKDE